MLLPNSGILFHTSGTHWKPSSSQHTAQVRAYRLKTGHALHVPLLLCVIQKNSEHLSTRRCVEVGWGSLRSRAEPHPIRSAGSCSGAQSLTGSRRPSLSCIFSNMLFVFLVFLVIHAHACPWVFFSFHVLVQLNLLGDKNVFCLRRFVWTRRGRGWALRVFNSTTTDARPAPGRDNTARAVYD